jgi:hypothetical protein
LRGRVHHTSGNGAESGLVVPSDESRMVEVAMVLREIGMLDHEDGEG